MSLDLVDLGLDMEEQFGVEITREDSDRLQARCSPPDIRAGDLYDLIQEKRPTKRRCRRCPYDLRGHASPGSCPECGMPFDDWSRFSSAVLMHVGKRGDKLTRDSLLVSDFERHW